MANENILIAEDDGIIAARLQSILNKLGYAVPAMVASGEDAIRQAAKVQPDLVLMDVELAGEMDGIEAGGQIRAQSGIPVVYLTAYLDDTLLQRAKMTEPYGYLVKPVQDRELRATIEVAIYKCRLDWQLRESEERYRAVAAELRRARDELDARVQERTAELSAANEALRRQANLLANVNDAIIATDEQGIITDWNPAAEELLGWSAAEAIGQPMADLTRPEFVSADSAEASSALAATGRWRGEVRHGTKGDTASICEVTTMTLKDTESTVTGYVSVIRDITQRKQSEEALRRYAERLQILHEVDRAILAAQSLGAIAQAALSYIQQLLVQCQTAIVIQFDLEARQGVVLATSFTGEADLKVGGRIPLEMFGDIEDFRQGKAHMIQDTQAASHLSPLIQTLRAGGVRSFVGVPLIVQNELVGSFNLGSDQPGRFASDNVDIAREVASSLAIAIQQARLFERLQAGRERLQTLSRRLVEVQEIERRRLAHELHDEIGQTLTAVKINLQALQRREDMAGVEPYLKDSIDVVEHALGQVRNLSLDLRPSLLDDLGLVATLRWYVDRQAQRGGFAAQLVIDLPEIPSYLPPELETICFRVVQEALTNIMRHSQARNVRVELRQREAELLLRVHDDGVGFDVQAALENAMKGASLGLLGIQERIWQVGGQIDIRSAPGGGTDIQACLPLSSPAPDSLPS
jgi:PAS domain S-box-containing protein